MSILHLAPNVTALDSLPWHAPDFPDNLKRCLIGNGWAQAPDSDARVRHAAAHWPSSTITVFTKVVGNSLHWRGFRVSTDGRGRRNVAEF